MDALKNIRWSGDDGHDQVLQEAINDCVASAVACGRMASEMLLRDEEQMALTAKSLKTCSDACIETAQVLAAWEAQDPEALRSTVESCALTCELIVSELWSYLPEAPVAPSSVVAPPSVLSAIRLHRGAVSSCLCACEEFIRVWCEGEPYA